MSSPFYSGVQLACCLSTTVSMQQSTLQRLLKSKLWQQAMACSWACETVPCNRTFLFLSFLSLSLLPPALPSLAILLRQYPFGTCVTFSTSYLPVNACTRTTLLTAFCTFCCCNFASTALSHRSRASIVTERPAYRESGSKEKACADGLNGIAVSLPSNRSQSEHTEALLCSLTVTWPPAHHACSMPAHHA